MSTFLHMSLWTLPNALVHKTGSKCLVWMFWCCMCLQTWLTEPFLFFFIFSQQFAVQYMVHSPGNALNTLYRKKDSLYRLKHFFHLRDATYLTARELPRRNTWPTAAETAPWWSGRAPECTDTHWHITTEVLTGWGNTKPELERSTRVKETSW